MGTATLSRAKPSSAAPKPGVPTQICVRVRVERGPLQYLNIPEGTTLPDFVNARFVDSGDLRVVVLNGDYANPVTLSESRRVLTEGDLVFLTKKRLVRIMGILGEELVAARSVPVVGLTITEMVPAIEQATRIHLTNQVRVDGVVLTEEQMSTTYVADDDTVIEPWDP
ncbi:MAG: hypothetical protein Q8P13_01800 [bacterium]|nr:hypothetical protein [bacterium]